MAKTDIGKLFCKGILVFDGAMGTMIQSMGLRPGDSPDSWCLVNPAAVAEVHRRYVDSGAQIVETNTFGATPIRLSHFGLADKVREINVAAVRIAREAAGDRALVAGCMGPLGSLVEPLGDVTFEEAYEAFAAQAAAFAEGEPDFIIIDTIADLNEMRAAILACKDKAPGIALITQMTLERSMRSFTGTPPEAAGLVMQSMGADVVGFNCSVGPDLMTEAVRRLAAVARVPVSVQPNAGMPRLTRDGRTEFPMGPEEFASYGPKLVAAGASIVGGCCGTTPEHVRLLRGAVEGLPARTIPSGAPVPASQGGFSIRALTEDVPASVKAVAAGPSGDIQRQGGVQPYLGYEFGLASRTRAVFAVESGLPLVIGERINPTGRKALSRELKEGTFAIVRRDARAQTEAGAVILDVNVGVPLIDEAEAMANAVRAAQEASALPLAFDSTSAGAIEAGLRAFVGKGLVNSFSLEEGKAERILPVAKRYGAAVLGLTIDENGIPDSAVGRLKVAERLVEKAASYGIPSRDVVIDPLTLSAGAQQSQVCETLAAIRLIKDELGCRTSLGVSNVSFGLPQRPFINAAFLNMAISAGLDIAIINPLDERMMDTVRAVRVLLDRDANAKEFISAVGRKRLVHTEDEALDKLDRQGKREDSENAPSRGAGAIGCKGGGEAASHVCESTATHTSIGSVSGDTSLPQQTSNKAASLGLRLHQAVMDGDEEGIIPLTKDAIAVGADPSEILNAYLIPAIGEVGKLFADGVYFLPQLMLSASAMKAAFDLLKPELARGKQSPDRGVAVIATVEGDIHDIGKNIVSVLLENHGFKVVDLGRDVKSDVILRRAREEGADVVCLSALMTTTMSKMKEVVDLFAREGFDCPVLVGGASTTKEFAQAIGAAGYGKDAQEAVELALQVSSKGR